MERARKRKEFGDLPDGDVVRILLDQHELIRSLFAQVKTATGAEKQRKFDELRGLLAVHETAEEMVLRPWTSGEAREVADARNDEEAEATKILVTLDDMDIDSEDWPPTLDSLQRAVEQHADREEAEEFPLLIDKCGADERRAMGSRLELVEKMAPTHPHPSTAGSPAANWMVGPFMSVVDRVRDAFGSDTR